MTSSAKAIRPFQPYRPKFIAALNGIGRLLESIGLRASLDAESLIAAARRKTGLQDFGDESFRTGLQVVTQSLDSEAHLHPVGRLIMRQRLIGLLAVRLKAQQLFARHPEIRRQPIEPPLVIAGLQRTGTTMLHRLLASDPRMRALRSYEAMNPLRDEYPAGTVDPRLKATRLAEKALKYMAPEFFAIHPVDADAPEEEILLLDYAFLSDVPESLADVPSYAAWLEKQDVTPAYEYMKSLLQLMQWQQPKRRWALKTPAHLGHMDVLLKVFPDARIIQTHRDPARTAASYSSMIVHGYGVFTDEVNPSAIAAHWHRKNVNMVEATMRVRAQHPDSFIDVSYYDVLKDPMAEVRRIYAFAGIELTDVAVAAMEANLKSNPQNKHGVHRYRLEDFGLTTAQIRTDYGAYSKFFGIPEEGKKAA
jgi:hypothetical protein